MPLPVPPPSAESKKSRPAPETSEQKLPGLPPAPVEKPKTVGLPVPLQRPAATAPQAPRAGLPSIQTPPPSPRPRPTAAPTVRQESYLPEGWTIDAKTGKKYKKLAANSPEAVAAGKKTSGFSLDQLMRYTQDDPDFKLEDLNGSAEMFLAHLRVPLPKEEIEAARRAQAARQASQASITQADEGAEA